VKRLALSLIGGLVIPLSYTTILGVVLLWTKKLALIRLTLPVSWPAFVLFQLLPHDFFPLARRPNISCFIRHLLRRACVLVSDLSSTVETLNKKA
jgi:hypothetical protein